MKKYLLLIPLLCGLCSAQSLSIAAKFNGITGNGSGNPNVPRPTIASNGTQLLETTGQTFTYYTTSGSVISTFTETAWLAAVSPTISCTLPLDPRADFLPASVGYGRWIVVQSCSSGDWLIISSSSDLSTCTWKAVALGGALGANGDLTMKIGYDKNGVYITEFDPNANPIKYTVYALPAADVLWSGAGTISLSNLQTFTLQNFELFPAIDLNASKARTSPENFAAVSSPQGTGSFSLLFNQLTWPSGAVGGACTNGAGATPCATLSANTTVSSGFIASTVVDAAQSGGNPLRASESFRVLSVRQVGTHLYIVRGTGPCLSSCGAQGTDVKNIALAWDVDPSALTITQSWKLSSGTISYLFPALAADQSGNLFICASASSASAFASLACWSRLTTDPLNNISGPVTVIGGTQNYGCQSLNPVPWGTYASSQQDPSDGTKVWVVNEYAASASDCVWQTGIAELTFASLNNPTPASSILARIIKGGKVR